MGRVFPALCAGVVAAVGCTSAVTDPDKGVVRTAVAIDSLNVTVLDRDSGQRVCDATVGALDGAFSQMLRANVASPCAYSGPSERAGVYDVQVSRPGYQPASAAALRVDRDQCHVIPVSVTVTLAR